MTAFAPFIYLLFNCYCWTSVTITKKCHQAIQIRIIRLSLRSLHIFSLLENSIKVMPSTVEPRFNEVLDIMNYIQCPCQSYNKMYGIESQYNEP